MELTNIKTSLFKKMEAQKISVCDLSIAISSIPPSVKEENEAFLEKKRHLLCNSQNRREVFLSVTEHTNYFNYSLLEHLVRQFGSHLLQKKMRAYVSKVQAFRKSTKLTIFAKFQQFPRKPVPESFKVLVTELDWSNKSLEDVEQFRRKRAWQYGLHEFIVLLYNVAEGCVELVWLVPAYLASYLREKIMLTKDELFRESNVIHVEMDGISLYSSKPQVTLVVN